MNSETTIEQIHTSHVGIKKLNTMIPVKSPDYQIDWGPFPSPSPSPSPSQSQLLPSPSPTPVDFSPPLIAMVVIVAAAFFIVTYFRLISRHLLPPLILFHQRWCHRWNNHRRRRRTYPPSSTDIESPPHLSSSSSSAFHFLSPFGLDDEVIKTLPLSKYNRKSFHDCAVCLLEFEENDYVRTLPICSHSFHLDCIDIWLRSHANCPLCRARISLSQSPFIPLMAARIRPSLDDEVLHNILLQRTESNTPAPEIRPSVDEISSRTETEERFNFLLKRSYSFGFERNLPADRTVMEAATATPWRYRRGGSFWSKRPSPFTKQRVFSFRYMKSPFFRRRGRFFPVSESNIRFAGSSRRSKSMTSPMFMRSSVTATSMVFSSSRMRCGDLEALLSPERLNRR